MDPISGMASVAGVATAAIQVSKSIYDVVQTVRNAPAEIIALSEDAHAINTIISTLSLLFKDQKTRKAVSNDIHVAEAIRNLERPLRNCLNLLQQLNAKLREHLKPVEGGGWKVSSLDLKWYFRKNDVRELVTRLESTKSSLDIALGSITVVCDLRSLGLDPNIARDKEAPRQRRSSDTDSSFVLKRFLESVAPDSPTIEGAFSKGATISNFNSSEVTPSDSISTREAERPPVHQAFSTSALERLRKKENQRAGLHKAARDGDDLVLELMLEEGVDVDVRAADGRTALHLIAENGNEAGARILLDHGANVNAVSYSKGSNVERKFGGGRTPMHWAAEYGQLGMVKLLVEAGADLAIQNASGRTVLQEAIRDGGDPVAKYLMNAGAPLLLKDDEGWTALHQAAHDGRTEIVEILLDNELDLEAVVADQNIWGWKHFGRATPLILAVAGSRVQTTQYLMSRGANIRAENIAGDQPIHIACWCGSLPLVKILLDAGIDIEIRDSVHNETPLLKAASTGKTDVVLYLLQKGADSNAKTQFGRNALVHSQLHEKGQHGETVFAIKKWMLEHGQVEDVKDMLSPEYRDPPSPSPSC